VPNVEITRRGDLSVADHLDEIRAWLDRERIQATGLRAVRILASRITFSANFKTADEADRFRAAFGK
jgi:hypothetical protein